MKTFQKGILSIRDEYDGPTVKFDWCDPVIEVSNCGRYVSFFRYQALPLIFFEHRENLLLSVTSDDRTVFSYNVRMVAQTSIGGVHDTKLRVEGISEEES